MAHHPRSLRVSVGFCKHSYGIEATNGEIGLVHGFLVEEGTSAIRYLVVEASHWGSGPQVLIVPEWIRAVSCVDRTVNVVLTRQEIKSAPRTMPRCYLSTWTTRLSSSATAAPNIAGCRCDDPGDPPVAVSSFRVLR